MAGAVDAGAWTQTRTLTRGAALHGVAPPGHELPRRGRMTIGDLPPDFDLRRVVMSHGWCGLPPSAWDDTARVLHRTLLTPEAGPLTVSVRQPSAGQLAASWGRVPGSTADRRAIRRDLLRMLALDVDLSGLDEGCAAVGCLEWVNGSGAGRLLRSPTVWEDLTRMLATTNCSWSLTRSTLTRLVATLGETGPAGERAFPGPASVAAAGVEHLRGVVRAGYRATSFVALAEACAGGRLGEEGWLDPPPAGHPRLDDAEVLVRIRALRGFGRYAAEGMLGLLGRPRGLGLDSWVRAKLPRLVGVPTMTDAEIAERYAALGRWAGTGLWLELTRDWFDPPSTASPRLR